MSDDDVAGDVVTAPGVCAAGGQLRGSVIAVSAADVDALASFSEGCLMCVPAHGHSTNCFFVHPSLPSAMPCQLWRTQASQIATATC